MPYEDAVQRLSRVPVSEFLAERKRLTTELRAGGDDAGAARLAKRAKPVMSVWAVNQLYWQAREAFDAMLAAAARVRSGDLGAAKAHYDGIAALRKRAAAILADAGYKANDATLRRIATTLAAIAAAGGFDPDPPGALAADRDPPGFDTFAATASPGKPQAAAESGAGSARERARAEARERAAAEAAERKRREAARVRRQAERARLEAALKTARAEVDTREQARAMLAKQLGAAEQALAAARAKLSGLEESLAQLSAEPEAPLP